LSKKKYNEETISRKTFAQDEFCLTAPGLFFYLLRRAIHFNDVNTRNDLEVGKKKEKGKKNGGTPFMLKYFQRLSLPLKMSQLEPRKVFNQCYFSLGFTLNVFADESDYFFFFCGTVKLSYG